MMLPREGEARRTFLLDTIRALPAGCVETMGMTFAVLIAVRVFDTLPWVKAAIVAAPSTGLLLSLFVVQLVRRTGWSVNRSTAGIFMVTAVSLLLAAMGGESIWVYVPAMCVALMTVTLSSTAPVQLPV